MIARLLARLRPARAMGVGFMLHLALLALPILALAGANALRQRDDRFHIAAPVLPPRIHADGTGIEIDAIRAALKAGGMTQEIVVHTYPFTKHWHAFQTDDRLDAVITVPAQMALPGYFSGVYTWYCNAVVSARPDGGHRQARVWPGSYRGKRIVAFAGAAEILDLPLADLKTQAGIYLERADQKLHTKMLLDARADVVIADWDIFKHYTDVQLGKGGTQKRFVAEFPFPPTPYGAYFRGYRDLEAWQAGWLTARTDAPACGE